MPRFLRAKTWLFGIILCTYTVNLIGSRHINDIFKQQKDHLFCVFIKLPLFLPFFTHSEVSEGSGILVFQASIEMEAYTYIYPRFTHLLTHSMIFPHNALVSHLKLVSGLRASLLLCVL